MTKEQYSSLLLMIGMALLASGIATGRSEVTAADCKLNVQLIWGTDEAKPKDKNLKEIDAKLADKLRRVFKWKNYLEVTTQNLTLSPQMSRTVSLSPKCKLELKRTDGETKKGEEAIIVKLYGEGNLVTTKRLPLKLFQQGEYSILAGDDKDKQDDAWFVVLSKGSP